MLEKKQKIQWRASSGDGAPKLQMNLFLVVVERVLKEKYHQKLHHILHCKERDLSPGTHSGSILA